MAAVLAEIVMDAPAAIQLASNALNLAQTLISENRSATAAEQAALWPKIDAADRAAVEADDAAQKAAGA